MRGKRKITKTRYYLLPASIRLVKIGVVILGATLWGWGFLWTVLGLYVAFAVLKRVLSCLLSLIVISAYILLLTTTL